MTNGLKNIETLKNEFDEVSSKENLAFVKFYEGNIDSIENIDINKDEDHYNAKLRLESEYGMSLYGSGYYTQAVEVLSKAIPMFENVPNQDKNKLKDITYFEHLLSSYAVSLYETKAINDSIKQFERLVQYKPKNEKYQRWLVFLKAKKISKYTKLLWMIIPIWLIGKILFFENYEPKSQLILSIIGGVLVLVASGFELYIYLIKKKK